MLDECWVDVAFETCEQVNRPPVYCPADLGRVLRIKEGIFREEIVMPK